ncbi:MAG TPA: DAK2 domain-containing protein [Herpetosiphonaceae bacterium]|nr:DAK2 domain-containing protein [Herpetosiphonaceae bacterium]
MVNSLTDLFEDITRGLEQDRHALNGLDDVGDGDAGDNMVANFATITNALRQVEGQNVTVDQALNHASDVLRQEGKGPTAAMYANGLTQAASNLQGKTGFSLNDLTGLLGGLLGGVKQTPGVREEGQGGLLDGLVPGITAFMESRNAGRSTIESLLSAFMASQRGALGTTRQSEGFGQASGKQTQGRVDPGAAGASSILGSLFGSLLSGGLSAGRGEQPRTPGLGDLFGGGLGDLFGGGGGGLGGLGGLFGGGATGGGSTGGFGTGAEPQARPGPKESI